MTVVSDGTARRSSRGQWGDHSEADRATGERRFVMLTVDSSGAAVRSIQALWSWRGYERCPMRQGSAAQLFLLGLLLLCAGCAMAVRRGECRVSLQEAERYPYLGIKQPTVGDQYFVEGLIYADFEESGLIAIPDLRPEDLVEELKWQSFCYRWTSACVGTTPRKFRVARIQAIVRYAGVEDLRSFDPPKRCGRGTVEVVRLASLWDIRR